MTALLFLLIPIHPSIHKYNKTPQNQPPSSSHSEREMGIKFLPSEINPNPMKENRSNDNKYYTTSDQIRKERKETKEEKLLQMLPKRQGGVT